MIEGNADAGAKAEQTFLANALKNQQQQLGRGPGTSDCMDCGSPINPERREALPSTRLCIGCAEIEDHRQRQRARR